MHSNKNLLYLSVVMVFMTISIKAQHLDMVIFGNDSSEASHNVESDNSSIGVGGLNEPFRKLESTDVENSYMTTTLKVKQGEQNYLTLKFWGSDTLENRQYLYLYYWQTIFNNLGKYVKIGGYGAYFDNSEVINLHNVSTYPNRFIYVTYMIPEDITEKIDSIKFKLAESNIPIYSAYTHTNSYFKPDEDEQQGIAPEFSGAYPSSKGQTEVEHLHEQLDLAVDRFLTWQYYGEEWNKWIANGWAPEVMTGALLLHGLKDSTWTLDEWQTTYSASQSSHVKVQMVIETIAEAYNAPWSKYYQDSTIIDRVVKALDFLRIAQGSNGGYVQLENRNGTWIGAPNRTPGDGSLMGFGMKGAPGAFLALQDEIMTSTLMNEIINEGDSLVTRRQAYINLFAGFRDYLTLTKSRGHASNQDVVNITAAYLADQCLHKITPDLAWSDATKQYWLDVCIGLKDGIYGGPWMSAKGTSLEGGGLAWGSFDGNYGEHNAEHLTRLYILSGEERVGKYLTTHLEALGRMRYLGYDNYLRPVVRREAWIGWRHTYLPGFEEYCYVPMAAILANDKISLRGVQLAAEHGAYFKVDYSQFSVHLFHEASKMMRNVDYIEQALEMPATDARLPFEEGQSDYAWADEQAATVVIKQGGCDLKATLQWRHPLLDDVRHVDNALPNDKARVHFTTPEYDLMATTAMQNTDGMYSLYIWQFDKYLVLMNASPDNVYEFELPEGSPSKSYDFISKTNINLSSNPVIEPQNTLILEWPEDITVSVGGEISDLPNSFELKQNYPNPFNPTTTIEYSIPFVESGHASVTRLTVYDILGNKIKTLVNKEQSAGKHKIIFNASELSSGIYFYTVEIGGFYQTKKMLLLK